MGLKPVPGARTVLSETTEGHTHRLASVIEEARQPELVVRQEIDQLALNGEVKRLYVGEHVMVKTTDAFEAAD